MGPELERGVWAHLNTAQDFPVGPVVKALHFRCRGQVQSLVRELSKILHATQHSQKIEIKVKKKTTAQVRKCLI